MDRRTSRLYTGIVLFIALGVLATGLCGRQTGDQDDVRAEPAVRLFARFDGVQDRSGLIRTRISQRLQPANDRGAESLEIAGLSVSVWRPSPNPSGRAPLVLFSHGFHGSSTQSTFLMKALAEHGYLVIAPNHKDAVRGKPGSGFSWRPEAGFGKADAWSDSTYKDRAEDITSLLRALKADQTWSAAIDWSRIALAGHSLGGYTVLGLAGGWPHWKLSEVKAVLALSPYCLPFLRQKSLGSLHVPVMYQGGTRDIGITPFVKRSGGAFDQTSAPTYFVEFEKAGHFAWTDLNPNYQNSIAYYSTAFLDKYLKKDGTADPTRRLPDVAELRAK
jgi:predicted dienelactone hydrolase